jgi:hypothetical protein
VLANDHVSPWEPLNFPIHYTCGMHPLQWIQRWHCWRLSDTCCTNYSNYLFTWRGGHGGQVHFTCGFLLGVFVWRRHWARSGSGGRSFTVVLLILHGECRKKVAIVDSFDALFGVQVEEYFGGFGCSWFLAFAKSPQIKGLLVPGCGLKVLDILILFFFLRGVVMVCISESQSQPLILATKVALQVSWRSSMRNFLGRAATSRE